MKGLFFIGEGVDFQGICKIYSPTVREILTNYLIFLLLQDIFIKNQDKINEELLEKDQNTIEFPTPYELLTKICEEKENQLLVLQCLNFLTHEENWIYLKELKKFTLIKDKDNVDVDNLQYLDENNYFTFQNLIRGALGFKLVEEQEDLSDKPEGLKKLIAKRAAAKRMYEKAKEKSNQGNILSFDELIETICLMECGVTPFNVGDLTLSAFQDLIKHYQNKQAYEIGIRSLQAGAKKSDVKLKNWLEKND